MNETLPSEPSGDSAELWPGYSLQLATFNLLARSRCA